MMDDNHDFCDPFVFVSDLAFLFHVVWMQVFFFPLGFGFFLFLFLFLNVFWYMFAPNIWISSCFQQNFTILKEADIQQRQGDDIAKVATVLFISTDAASILLRHYNW